MSEKLKGRETSDDWRANLSAARKSQYANGYCPVWINNGQIETTIQKGQDIPEGFQIGRLSLKDTYIHRGQESKKIARVELDTYLSQGWDIGRPCSVRDNIRKKLQKYYWICDGICFEYTSELLNYLHENGYPKIVDSTLDSLCKKGFDKSPTYCSLQGRIQRIKL